MYIKQVHVVIVKKVIMFCAKLAAECSSFLHSEVSKKPSFLRNIAGPALLDWFELADKCDLEKLIPFCIAELVGRGKVS
jgi:hypothetical protein